ncbi:unnamed protein product [Caenorhabditis bovis]|uniref:Uncharacterized protein n=1 Tax=Caenorhabditis bovis TaxID=2654633 RepID=A0A8S1F7E6_9PELO|nr:unnamed protein product [Caenorhabditis bovis]
MLVSSVLESTAPVETLLADSHFLNWCQLDPSLNGNVIELYGEITDYESKCESNASPLNLVKLARHIHRKYVSKNTGTCHVIDDAIREKMSSRIHELLAGKPATRDLFDPLKPALVTHLRVLFARYNHSDNDSSEPWDDPELHASDDSRNAFFTAVCSKLEAIKDDDVVEETIKRDGGDSPYGANGFAPPPPKTATTTMPRRFESLYRKKRQSTSDSSGFGSDFTNIERGYSKSGVNTLERTVKRENTFSTLQPRKKDEAKLTIELRHEYDVPMVAKISPQPVNFRYFRNLFGVQYTEDSRFFFKSFCEDGTALYQWTLIYRDDDELPRFDGKITAICRTCPYEESSH